MNRYFINPQQIPPTELKPNGLVFGIMTSVIGVLFLAFAFFDQKAKADSHQFAMWLGIFMLLVSFVVFFRRNNNTLLKLSTQGIWTPLSDIIIPWAQVIDYQFTTLNQGPFTISCTLEIFLNESYHFLDRKRSKHSVIYQPKKHVIALSAISFRPSISELDALINQYIQIATKEQGVRN